MPHEYITLGPKALDLSGQKFGRLTALGPVERRKRHVMWLCECQCGETTIVSTTSLRAAATRSCGCLRQETSAEALTKHGMKNSPLYRIWCNIVSRCTLPTNHSYARYGGRGITICDEWRHDFQAFYDHVTQLPCCGEKGYSLDRILNDGPYAPGNVQWATTVAQARNKRNNRLLTYNGKTLCVAAWAEEIGINLKTLENRIRTGWSVERALTVPVKRKHT
jgi:hypothetical protein